MKSYFAKLADRATLANLPASSGGAAAPMSDPFEQTSLSQVTAPAPVVAESGPASDYHRGPDSRGSALTGTQPVSRKSERSDPIQFAPSELPNKIRFDPPASRILYESRSEQYELEQPPPRVAAPLVPQAERPPVAPSAHDSHESQQASTNAIADNDERLAEIEREQAVLLRKSDAFMESLLRRREAPTKRHEVESDEAEPRGSYRHEEPRELKQPRLQPSPREPEPDDRPSLVIGSLTIEVAPPAPPPVAPRREVVIVRGSPTVRSLVPSSRRFGLGQF